jgi:DinB superfamily
MPDTPEFLAERLLQEGQKTQDFFRVLELAQWDIVIYTEGMQWTVRQVLAHFVATEGAIQKLMKNILEGGPGSPSDFNIDAYNERKVAALREATPQELIGQFSHLRQKSAALVSGMTQEDLNRRGRHPFLGVTDLSEIIKLLYRHNQIHQRDVRKLLI